MSIDGRWIESPPRNHAGIVIWGMRFAIAFVLCSCGFAQPKFEAATIKPVRDDAPTGGVYTGHGRMNAYNITLKRLIMGAYHIEPSQVVGGPPWLDIERFNIVAKSPKDINDDDVLDVMEQALLAERFHLELHREPRPMPAYVSRSPGAGRSWRRAAVASRPSPTHSTPCWHAIPEWTALPTSSPGL